MSQFIVLCHINNSTIDLKKQYSQNYTLILKLINIIQPIYFQIAINNYTQANTNVQLQLNCSFINREFLYAFKLYTISSSWQSWLSHIQNSLIKIIHRNGYEYHQMLRLKPTILKYHCRIVDGSSWFIDVFGLYFVIVMMTHFEYNSYTHPGHMKSKQNQSYISQMITQSQSSIPIHNYEGKGSLKPWYFKPKKTLFRVDDDHTIKKKKKFNSLHWSQQENYRYAQFLSKYSSLVQGQVLEKRRFHLNRMMSKHVKTRSPVQCRSHHQKMLKSFKNIEEIIQHFQANQPPVETSASLQIELQKADENNENCHLIQANRQDRNNEDQPWQDKREDLLQESCYKMFDEIRCSGDIFSEWGIYSLPYLDSYQV